MVLEYFRCDFEMVLIWFGNGASFSGFLTGWLSRKETETAPGQPFGRFLAGFCGFDILIWL